MIGSKTFFAYLLNGEFIRAGNYESELESQMKFSTNLLHIEESVSKLSKGK